MSKVFFFDFDGVILDSVNIKTEAFRFLFEPFGKEISDQVVDYHLEHGGISRVEKFKYYYKELLNKPLPDKQLNELCQQFESIISNKINVAAFIPNVIPFLEKIYKENECYIISGTPERELKKIISDRNIEHYFRGIFGSPEKKISVLKKLFKKYKYNISDCYFLGDSNTDFEAANYYKLKFILIRNAHNSDLSGDYEITDFSELKL